MPSREPGKLAGAACNQAILAAMESDGETLLALRTRRVPPFRYFLVKIEWLKTPTCTICHSFCEAGG